MGSKYSWIVPGVRVEIVGVIRTKTFRNRRIVSSFNAELCRTATVLETWRHSGHPRRVEVEYDPPNFGIDAVYASEIMPLEVGDESDL